MKVPRIYRAGTTPAKRSRIDLVRLLCLGAGPQTMSAATDGAPSTPRDADGLSGLGAALKTMADAGVAIHRVLDEGNFVLVVSDGSFAGAHTAFVTYFASKTARFRAFGHH